MDIVKLSCQHCGKNHTCKGAIIKTQIKEVYIYKKTKDERRKIKIEQNKPIVKMKKMEFNVMN